MNSGKKSGIHFSCNASVDILEPRTDWAHKLRENKNMIFIADERVEYLTEQSFGAAVNESENYFLFITRSGLLGNMTYAIKSILELSTNKQGSIFYSTAYMKYMEQMKYMKPDLLITEDSNSGNEMMKILLNEDKVKAGCGKDNIINIYRRERNKYNNIILFVDGAAFGSCIGKYDGYLNELVIVAPESFEYLLLKTKPLYKYVKNELENTAEYCDFKGTIISYERYYTELLKRVLSVFYSQNYSKTQLNSFFKQGIIYEQIKGMLPEIDFVESV